MSDVGEGNGGNYSVAYVYDRLKDQFVCRMRTNRVDADEWAFLLIMLAVFYNKTKLCVERVGPGFTTITTLQKRYSNLYINRREGRTSGTWGKEYGFVTTDHTKRLIIDNLKAHFRDIFDYVPCPLLLDESSTFIQVEGTLKLRAEPGKHDDCVMAAALTLQCSKTLPAVTTFEEKKETGWRETLWGDPQDDYKLYDVSVM